MSSHPTNLYVPAKAMSPSPLFTPDVFPGGKHEIFTRSRHSRRRGHDIENVNRDHDASTPREDRRRTIDNGPVRPPLTPWNDATQAGRVVRILPQRMIAPASSTGVQSIWFRFRNEHPDFGVSLMDVVDDEVEKSMVAPEERVFQRFGLDCEEIQFSILWPGYGHISWIASIPIQISEGSGYQCGPITRGLLASAVAQHYRAFMTNHSYLRFPNSDPSWKIMNEQENGIKFEDLRLTRLFSHKDGTGKLGPWQAEILVVGRIHTHPHRCIN